MKRQLIGLMAVAATLAMAVNALACGCPPTKVCSDDPTVRQHAIEQFRDYGPMGLKTLLRHRELLLASGVDPKSDKMRRLEEAIDAVGGAKYCTASRLFWHTDLDKAKAAAATSTNCTENSTAGAWREPHLPISTNSTTKSTPSCS